MEKFDGKWTTERVSDLRLAHKGRSHTETSIHLSQKWNCVVSRDAIKNKYNSLKVENISAKINSEDPVKSRENYNIIKDDSNIQEKRRYVVTSAVAGSELDINFYNSIQTYLKENNSQLVVLPMRGSNSKDEEYDEELLNLLEKNFYTEYVFNSNLVALDINLSPTQTNPLTGLYRIAEDTSVIISATKQHMEVIPVGNVGVPHLLQASGSITKGFYSNSRIGLLAGNDHVVGAIIVEIEDDKIFHIRQIQAGQDGSFYDLNKLYSEKGVKLVTTEAFVPGDIHNGFQSEKAMKCWDEVIKLIKPKYIALHDVLDCRSISHWLENNITEKTNREGIFATLKSELTGLHDFLDKFCNEHKSSQVLIVASNHNEHLDRYIDSARFFQDYPNYRTALELAIYSLDGVNILKSYIENNFKKLKNLVWLERDQDFRVAGVQLAVHGDVGNNGSRGSAQSLEKSYHNMVIGHSHSPKIMNEVYQVGTSTRFSMPYSVGASSWLHAGAIVHKNGSKQMIIDINGTWRIENPKKKQVVVI